MNDLGNNTVFAESAKIDLYQDQFTPGGDNPGNLDKKGSQFTPESECSLEMAHSCTGKRRSTQQKPLSDFSCLSESFYFREVGRIPLLSPEEEKQLAIRIFEGERRVKTLLLQSPVGLEWLGQTVNQMEKNEIQPKDVMEVFASRRKESEKELRKRFISSAKEILGMRSQIHYAKEEVERLGGKACSPVGIFPQNQIASLLDGIPLKPKVITQLERALRSRSNPMACRGQTSWPASLVKGLEGILSAVQTSQHDVTEAKDKLIKANLRLVIHVAKRYVNLGLSLPDLIQEGNIGLMKAVDRFDYRKGRKFSTFASWCIFQGITRGIACQGRLIRIPVHKLEGKLKMRKTFDNLYGWLGRTPTLLEVAETANIPLDKVKKLLRTPTETPVSLDAPIGDSGKQLSDFLTDENGVSPLEMAIHNDLRQQIRKILASLEPREARILRKRFGIDEERNYTMEELGHQFGVSKERIRQIQKKAMMKLEHPKRKRALEGLCE